MSVETIEVCCEDCGKEMVVTPDYPTPFNAWLCESCEIDRQHEYEKWS